jgi:alpha-L-rhamnosidase
MKLSAKWIWTGWSTCDLVDAWVDCRRKFRLARKPSRAEVMVTADARYRLFVNGEHVMRGPARGFQKSWPVDRVDIAPFLRRGANVIAAVVHNPGIGTFQYVHAGSAGFLLAGGVGGVDLSTGPEWRVRRAPGRVFTTARVSIQLGFQERFDARRDDGRWLRQGYDDSSWSKPSCHPLGGMPWHELEERGIPLLRETPAFPANVISWSEGVCAENAGDAPCVTRLFISERRKWNAAPSRNLLRQERSPEGDGWSRLIVPPAGRDRFRSYCIDFGREVVGSLRLAVSGAAGGEVIDSLAFETIDGLAPVVPNPDSGCRLAFGNRLILRRGRTEHEQFDHWGFRYLVLVVRGAARPLDVRLRLHAVGYPMDIKAEFKSSSERLNRIYEISVRTQQCCMLDAYMDCPMREQAQWWGDARVQARNTFFLSADARLLARGIRQIGTQEVPNGLSYGHAPTIAHNCVLPDFTLTWALTHWDYYWQTGRLDLFESMKERVHRAFAYFRAMTAPNGLLPHDRRYWLFLDWCGVFKDGFPALYNLLYLAALEAAERLFGLSGDRRAAAEYGRRCRAVRSAIERRLFDRKRGEIFGGLTPAGKPVRQDQPHAYAWAVLLDLFPDRHEDFIERHLLPLVRGNGEHPLRPSPFFMYYVFEALKKAGRSADVVDCIGRWWGTFIDRGLSTTPEVWESKPGWSECHAWSAHPIVHLSETLLGVRQEGLAWRKVRIEPEFAGLDFAEGRVATPLGSIECSWKAERGGIRGRVRLPAGMKGTLVLPGRPSRPLPAAKNVLFAFDAHGPRTRGRRHD